jgi:hypothetical protein
MKKLKKNQRKHSIRRANYEMRARKKRLYRRMPFFIDFPSKPMVAINRATKTIKVPAKLDLDENRSNLMLLLEDIRTALMRGAEATVFLDFRSLRYITSEAGLILLAEISRCLAFINNRLLRGNVPEDPIASQILCDLGYYDFFKLAAPAKQSQALITLKAVANNLTDGKIVDQLIQVFESQLQFHGIARRKLYEAMIECMQNVRHHAYPKKRTNFPYPINHWWMVGFSNLQTGEISFSFVDLGISIPKTLESKWRTAIRLIGVKFGQSELIVEAMEKHQSRLKNIRRGNGLSVLREMLNQAPEGRFRILSGRAHIKILRHSSKIDIRDEKEDFGGTFISWVLYPQINSELYADRAKGA